MFHRDEDDGRNHSEGEKVSLYRKSDPAKAIEQLSFARYNTTESKHTMQCFSYMREAYSGSGIGQVRSGKLTDFLARRQSEALDEEKKSCRNGLLALPQFKRSKGER